MSEHTENGKNRWMIESEITKDESRRLRLIVLSTALLFLLGTPAAAISSNGEMVATAFQATEAGPSDRSEFEAFIDSYLGEMMEARHIPGVVFSAVRDGEVFFQKGYGYADLDAGIPFDPSGTLLTAASLGKAFTALGVLQLYAQGKIDLNEDVRPYFTEFALGTTFDEPLTFAHLLTHRDGFETRMIDVGGLDEEDLLPLDELLATYAPTQLYSPGEYMTYGDHAANLAGYLVQEVSGLRFEDYMAENILDPLGMASSTFYQVLPEQEIRRLATAYEYDGEKLHSLPAMYVR